MVTNRKSYCNKNSSQSSVNKRPNHRMNSQLQSVAGCSNDCHRNISKYLFLRKNGKRKLDKVTSKEKLDEKTLKKAFYIFKILQEIQFTETD